jgi:hypothetical protein
MADGARCQTGAAVALRLLQLAVQLGKIDRPQLLQSRGAEMRPHMVFEQLFISLVRLP